MAQSGFGRALKRVLVIEGGKVDDPHDPGGRTNQGVTQVVFDAYLRGIGRKPRDVYTMTNAERDAIYKKRFWTVIAGDKLPPGVDYVVFDGAVNSGAVQSIKWCQRALGTRYTGRIDGQMGVLCLDAIASYPDHDKLIDLMEDRRLAFMEALQTWSRYGAGWMRRVDDVRKTGELWAAGSEGPPVNFIPLAQVKASIEDAKKMPVKAMADAGVGAGGTATTASGAGYGLTDMIDTTKSSLSELWYIETIQKILIGLTLLGLAIAIGGGIYAFFARRREAKLRDALDIDALPVRVDPMVMTNA